MRGHRRAPTRGRPTRHKWLNVPYDSGFAFVRDADAAPRGDDARRRLPTSQAEGAERDPYNWVPESSRRARGVRGLRRAAVARARPASSTSSSATARHARAGWPTRSPRADGVTILNDVVLNQVLVRFEGAETTGRHGRRRPDPRRHRRRPARRDVLAGRHDLGRSCRDARLDLGLADHRRTTSSGRPAAILACLAAVDAGAGAPAG